ncbi:MAG: hypothetical protein AAGF04_04490 [Chlamydiota bacterium]
MRFSKKPYLLLEVCIALSLSGLLLATLLSSYVSFYQIDHKMRRARHFSLERSFFANTVQGLMFTIPKAAQEMGVERSMYSYDHRGRQALFFVCDAGVQPSPTFSGPLFASLLLDEKSNLSLVFWPSDEKTQVVRTTPLIERVSDLKITFFVEEEGAFFWSKELKGSALPSMLRISFVQEKEARTFAFFLPVVEPLPQGVIPA